MYISSDSFKVGQAVRLVLPIGTFPGLQGDITNGMSEELANTSPVPWTPPPLNPADVFAVAAFIVHQSGLMGFFDPNPNAPRIFDPLENLGVSVTDVERAKYEAAGVEWSEDNDSFPPPLVFDAWADIIDAWNLPLRAQRYQYRHRKEGRPSECPSWWGSVFALLITSDEASASAVGAFHEQKEKTTWDLSAVNWRQIQPGNDGVPLAHHASSSEEDPVLIKGIRGESTYASLADPAVLCVHPKARVSQLGSTLRNITHNLSTTGPVGNVRSSWKPILDEPKHESDEGLDILLIPLPYEINAQDFKTKELTGEQKRTWGNFYVDQTWLPLNDDRTINEAQYKLFEAKIIDLVDNAKQDVASINAAIFPELSLRYEVFERLVFSIKKASPKIEFIVAGSSNNCDYEEGNFVVSAIWDKNPLADQKNTKNTSSDILYITSQKKHHRWKMDGSQLRYYGLSSILHPERIWWEELAIGQREIGFFQFRKGSVFAALICEDLARSDPVHEILRSVAPNLVFALLMDGPQIIPRWPARYASTLADDPGSSVLTLTSYALVKRANETSGWEQSRSIALWKDESGFRKEIEMDKGASAVLLSLTGIAWSDRTIDNRQRDGKCSWRFGSIKSIFASGSVGKTLTEDAKAGTRNPMPKPQNSRPRRRRSEPKPRVSRLTIKR